jgi:hypothetical protein
MIKMKSLDEHEKRRRNVELEQQAGDDVLFVINPGPHRKKSTRVSGLSAKKPKGGNSARPASRRRLRDLFLLRVNLPFPPHQPFKKDHRKNAEHPHMRSRPNGCWNLGKPVLGIWAASVPFRSPVS